MAEGRPGPPPPAWICPECGARLEAGRDGLECPGCGHRLERRHGVVWTAPDFRPEGFAPGRREHLEALARDHFWFPPRRRLLARLLDRWVDAGPGAAAIELGCGTGGFLPELADRFACVVAVDGYSESLAAAEPAPPGVELVQGDVTRVPLDGGRFRLAAALDVLEHEEPDAILSEAARLVEPGGWLLLTVPAFQGLWSELDEAAGHRCRYSRSLLDSELDRTGWRIVHRTHYQFLLLPLVWAVRRSPWRRGRRLERRPPEVVARLLGAVNAAEVRLLGGLGLPWGSSLVALARRTES